MLGLVGGPAVQGVAPALAGDAETVGRYAGDYGGTARLIELKQFGAGPDLCTLVGDENRDIAHDAHATGIGIGLEPAPLTKKHPLAKLPKQAGPSQSQACLGQGRRLAPGQGLSPLVPGLLRVLRLQRHEQGIVVQPGRLLLAKNREILAIRRTGTGFKPCCSRGQDAHAKGDQGLEIHRLVAQTGGWRQRVGVQPALPLQVVQVDQQRVAGKCRTAHVGRVAQANAAERQHLPQGLPARHQPVDKMVGRWPEVAATVRAWQRSGVQ